MSLIGALFGGPKASSPPPAQATQPPPAAQPTSSPPTAASAPPSSSEPASSSEPTSPPSASQPPPSTSTSSTSTSSEPSSSTSQGAASGPASAPPSGAASRPAQQGTLLTASAVRFDVGAPEPQPRAEDQARAYAIAAQKVWRLSEIVGALGTGPTAARLVEAADRPGPVEPGSLLEAVKIVRGIPAAPGPGAGAV